MKFDFERSFGRGLAVLVLMHFLLAFFTIYLFESFMPRIHDSLEHRLQLRVEIDGLARSLNQLPAQSEADFVSQWTGLMDKTAERMKDSKVPYPAFAQLRALQAAAIHSQTEVREMATQALTETIRTFDKDAGSTIPDYRNSILFGGWMVALLSVLGLLCFAYFHSSIRRHLVNPLREIYLVMDEWKKGNRLRRCQSPYTSQDIKRMLDRVNESLDAVDFGKTSRSHEK